MKVLILAAGYGTRLYPLTKDKPKPLLPIEDNKPLINYLIENVKGAKALNEIYIITNDKFYGKFQEWALQCKKSPVKITVVNDGTTTPEGRRGSIGDIDFAIKTHKVNEDILVIGGDNLFNFKADQFFNFAMTKTDKVTLGLYQIKDVNMAKHFGVVAMDANGVVTSFEEKPQHPKSNLIAMCFYYMPKNTLSLITQYIVGGGKVDLAGDYIRWLCEQKRLCGFQFQGSWYDIGSLEAYHEAQEDFKKHK
ncbi:MAG: nucleotidyltransferase family protein [Candidatus Omnitrophica bacterium]|nr:nucleotidyltransferase family protein [Candidatus Omnitrophota bacterium]